MNTTLSKILFVSLAFIAPINFLFYTIYAFIFLDFITGVWKTLKNNGVWKKITILKHKIQLPLAGLNSHTAKRTIIKTICYTIALLTTYILESQIIGSGVVLSKIVAGFISMVEVASIFENLGEISANPVFMKIFDYISTYFNKNKNIINKIDGAKDESNKDTKKEDI